MSKSASAESRNPSRALGLSHVVCKLLKQDLHDGNLARLACCDIGNITADLLPWSIL